MQIHTGQRECDGDTIGQLCEVVAPPKGVANAQCLRRVWQRVEEARDMSLAAVRRAKVGERSAEENRERDDRQRRRRKSTFDLEAGM